METINENNEVQQALQDILISSFSKNKVRVSIHLQKGIKLCGEIAAYDDNIITLRDHQKTQIIYKHAISTIVPDIEI